MVRYDFFKKNRRLKIISNFRDSQNINLGFFPQIILEGCVNTLQEECTHFYENHGHDGRNNSANSRYPCYYTPDNSGSF